VKPDIVMDGATGPFIVKVCGPYVPNAWRSMTIVGFTWTAAAGSQKFSWGRPLGATSTANAQSLPANNCGWRAS
jgi:hypothetical protein